MKKPTELYMRKIFLQAKNMLQAEFLPSISLLSALQPVVLSPPSYVPIFSQAVFLKNTYFSPPPNPTSKA